MVDINPAEFTIGLVGTGAMGRGIAQIAVAAGFPVRLFDTRDGAVAEAADFIGKMLARAAEKGSITADAAKDATARLTPVTELGDMAPCDMIVEAIVENLEAKRALFKSLESLVAPNTILASNTSSLSVTAIAAGCKRPQRVAGWHFFNPVPLLKLVETVDGGGAAATRRCAPRTPPASWSTTPAARSAPRRCASYSRALPSRRPSIASCATSRASAWARSSCWI